MNYFLSIFILTLLNKLKNLDLFKQTKNIQSILNVKNIVDK